MHAVLSFCCHGKKKAIANSLQKNKNVPFIFVVTQASLGFELASKRFLDVGDKAGRLSIVYSKYRSLASPWSPLFAVH